MRVTMRETRQAAPDGVSLVSLIAGQEYDLPPDLARSYLARGLASEPKSKGPAPENKAERPVPESKAPSPGRPRRSARR